MERGPKVIEDNLETVPKKEDEILLEEISPLAVSVSEKDPVLDDKIKEIKDRLLEQGAVIIEPIEHDPFTLSKNHVPTGEGVTMYKPDGTIEKMSIENYRRENVRGRLAAQFFERSQQGSEPPTSPNLFFKLVGGWFKKILSKLDSKK